MKQNKMSIVNNTILMNQPVFRNGLFNGIYLKIYYFTKKIIYDGQNH
jgi:hypothetical protein